MVGLSAGEYVPAAPSFLAIFPFGPEYFGKSNFPPSSEKWRCPLPGCGALPTAFGSILKLVSLTLAVNFRLTLAFGLGFTNPTAIFGRVIFWGVGLPCP